MQRTLSRHRQWEAVRGKWPNASASRFVQVGYLDWHVQTMGDERAPGILLLHGTGASTHSFRHLMPLLARDFYVVAPDLPGHGFTATPHRNELSLPGMTHMVLGLLTALRFNPAIAAGHSAGAAILCAMASQCRFSPRHIVSINGAFEPIQGNTFYAPLARLLFINPLVPRLFALRARYGDVTDVILSKTGSQIDEVGKSCYRKLLQSPDHISGALGMMSNWDLHALQRSLADIRTPVTLIAAADDLTVPASVSRRAAEIIPGARFFSIPHGGHLLHEVDAQSIATIISGLPDR